MGPLDGIRVLEFAGLGPAPFAAMLLSDLGAEVIRIVRPGAPASGADVLTRGRATLTLDLKSMENRTTALALAEKADLLIEGFRPGVMERLGLGPAACHAKNPGLVYGRMTGWGQDGPLAHTAGHDINYLAITGALWSMGEPDRPPVPPLNFLGDFGAGATFLVIGLLAGLHRARATGHGDIVDAAICDGTNTMMGFLRGQKALGRWTFGRGANRLDGSAPNYRLYACADGKWLSVGALESKFFATMLALIGFEGEEHAQLLSLAAPQEVARRLEARFLTRTRDEWCAVFDGADCCVAPVLDPDEALAHPHMRARGLNPVGATGPEPAPAPRFAHARLETGCGRDGSDAARTWGVDLPQKARHPA